MKLFNVIQQSQTAAVTVQEEKRANRGSGKPSLHAPVLEGKKSKKKKDKDNIIGRGKECALFPLSLYTCAHKFSS